MPPRSPFRKPEPPKYQPPPPSRRDRWWEAKEFRDYIQETRRRTYTDPFAAGLPAYTRAELTAPPTEYTDPLYQGMPYYTEDEVRNWREKQQRQVSDLLDATRLDFLRLKQNYLQEARQQIEQSDIPISKRKIALDMVEREANSAWESWMQTLQEADEEAKVTIQAAEPVSRADLIEVYQTPSGEQVRLQPFAERTTWGKLAYPLGVISSRWPRGFFGRLRRDVPLIEPLFRLGGVIKPIPAAVFKTAKPIYFSGLAAAWRQGVGAAKAGARWALTGELELTKEDTLISPLMSSWLMVDNRKEVADLAQTWKAFYQSTQEMGEKDIPLSAEEARAFNIQLQEQADGLLEQAIQTRSVDLAVQALQARYTRTDLMDYTFRYSWFFAPDGREREDKALRDLAAVTIQKGSWLEPWEIDEITNRSTDPTSEFIGEIIFDPLNLIPGAVWEKLATPLRRGVKGLARFAANTAESAPLIGDMVRYLRSESLISASNTLGMRSNNILAQMSRRVEDTNELRAVLASLPEEYTDDLLVRYGLAEDDFLFLRGADVGPSIASLVPDPDELERIVNSAHDVVYRERLREITPILPEGKELTKVQKAKLSQQAAFYASHSENVFPEISRRIVNKFIDGHTLWRGRFGPVLDEGLWSWFAKKTGLTVDLSKASAAQRRAIDRSRRIVELALGGAQLARSMWINMVLSLRPGFTIWNAMDSHFRAILGGADLTDDIPRLAAIYDIPAEILERFSGLDLFGQDLSQLIMRGEAPTNLYDLAKAAAAGHKNPITKAVRIAAAVNVSFETSLSIRLYTAQFAKQFAYLEKAAVSVLPELSDDVARELVQEAWIRSGADLPRFTEEITRIVEGRGERLIPPDMIDNLAAALDGDKPLARQYVDWLARQGEELRAKGLFTPAEIDRKVAAMREEIVKRADETIQEFQKALLTDRPPTSLGTPDLGSPEDLLEEISEAAEAVSYRAIPQPDDWIRYPQEGLPEEVRSFIREEARAMYDELYGRYGGIVAEDLGVRITEAPGWYSDIYKEGFTDRDAVLRALRQIDGGVEKVERELVQRLRLEIRERIIARAGSDVADYPAWIGRLAEGKATPRDLHAMLMSRFRDRPATELTPEFAHQFQEAARELGLEIDALIKPHKIAGERWRPIRRRLNDQIDRFAELVKAGELSTEDAFAAQTYLFKIHSDIELALSDRFQRFMWEDFPGPGSAHGRISALALQNYFEMRARLFDRLSELVEPLVAAAEKGDYAALLAAKEAGESPSLIDIFASLVDDAGTKYDPGGAGWSFRFDASGKLSGFGYTYNPKGSSFSVSSEAARRRFSSLFADVIDLPDDGILDIVAMKSPIGRRTYTPAAEVFGPPGSPTGFIEARENILKIWTDAGIKRKQAESYLTVMDSIGSGWSRRTGGSVKDFWATMFDQLGYTPEGLAEDIGIISETIKRGDLFGAVADTAAIFRKQMLTDVERRIVEDWIGVADGAWTPEHEQTFVDAFGQYIRSGQAPAEGLQGVFDKLKDWLTRIYRSIMSSAPETELPVEITRIFDRWLVDTGIADEDLVWAAIARNHKISTVNFPTYEDYVQFAQKRIVERQGELPGISGFSQTQLEALEIERNYLLFGSGLADSPPAMPELPQTVKNYLFMGERVVQNRDALLQTIDDIGTFWKQVEPVRLNDAQLLEIKEYARPAIKMKKEIIRKANYGGTLDAGDLGKFTVDGAVHETNRHMVDYAHSNKFARMMKQIFPFWKFPSSSLPFWAGSFVEHPEILAFYWKIVEASKRSAYRRGAVTASTGEPLPSLRGYLPIPGTDYWINPLAPFSFRYALPRLYEYEADPDVKLAPMQEVSLWAMDWLSAFGMNPGPWFSLPAGTLGLVPQEMRPLWALFPQANLIPRWWERSLISSLRRVGFDKLAYTGGVDENGKPFVGSADIAGFFHPDVSWKSFLIERELLLGTLGQLGDVPRFQGSTQIRMVEVAKQALTPEGRAQNEHARELWEQAYRRVEESEAYRNWVGYMSGVYMKEHSSFYTEMQGLRTELNTLRAQINDKVQADLFSPYPDVDQRYTAWVEMRFRSPEGQLARTLTNVSHVELPDGAPAFGADRERIKAYRLEVENQTQAFFIARQKAYDDFIADYARLPVGATSEERSALWQAYFDEIARIEGEPMYELARREWLVGSKPEKNIYAYLRNLWFQTVQSTEPRWNPDQESWTSFEARRQEWLNNMITEVAPLADDFFSRLKEVREQASGVQYPDNLLPRLIQETTPEGYLAWQKENDHVFQALDKVWRDNFWSVYWEMHRDPNSPDEMLKGKAWAQADRAFESLFPQGVPTNEELIRWIRDEYGDRFSEYEILEAIEGRGVLNVEERRARLQDEQYSLIQDARQAVRYLSPGQDWSDFEDIYVLRGGDADDLDTLFNASRWQNPDRLKEVHDRVLTVTEELNVRPPTNEQLAEEVEAQGLNDKFWDRMRDLYGDEVIDLAGSMWELSSRDRQAYFERYPEIERVFNQTEREKDEYALLHPLWAKYYRKKAYDPATATRLLLPEWKSEVDEAEGLDFQFRQLMKEVLGPDVWDVWYTYYGLSTSERSAWRKANPEQYDRIQQIRKYKDIYGDMNPLWDKWFSDGVSSKNVKKASSGSGGGRGGGRASVPDQVRTFRRDIDFRVSGMEEPFLPMGRRSAYDVSRLMIPGQLGRAGVPRVKFPSDFERTVGPVLVAEILNPEPLPEPAKKFLSTLKIRHPDWRDFIDEVLEEDEQKQPISGGGGGRNIPLPV